ncbi:hypothetical protein ACSBL2_19010 [Pedobacter sp. AW31-3R]|uniref:hypothetical protein n=1 Tax=Pedobacter sp. AW31-3R TaxID=3445781 RepID=UPI003FA08850
MDHFESETHQQQVNILNDQLHQLGDLQLNDLDVQMSTQTASNGLQAEGRLSQDADVEALCRSLQYTPDTAVSRGRRQRLRVTFSGWRYIAHPFLYLLQTRQTLSLDKTSTSREAVAFPGLLIWMCTMVAMIILKTYIQIR